MGTGMKVYGCSALDINKALNRVKFSTAFEVNHPRLSDLGE